MNSIRELVQDELSQLTDINCGVAKPDGMVVEGETFFGYELQETYVGEDFNKNYLMEINLTGRLVRKVVPTENTLQIVDNALETIKNSLKSLNFKYTYNDISDFTDGFIKIYFRGQCRYTELNKNILL